MRILLIPDVHGRPFWNDAIKQHGEECDKIISEGVPASHLPLWVGAAPTARRPFYVNNITQ